MNIILGNGISALALSELKPDFLMFSNKRNLGGQMGARFQLGPRILHHSKKVEVFLNKLGIVRDTSNFSVLYVVDDKLVPKLGGKDADTYFAKTRGVSGKNKSCINSSISYFKGYDLEEIGLLNVLKSRNIDKVIEHKILSIDLESKYIWTTSGGCKYDNLINTLDLEEFLSLVENPRIIEEYKENLRSNKKNVVFTLVSRKSKYNEIFSYKVNNFIYFVNSDIINRATFINEEELVLESNYKISESWLNTNGLIEEDAIKTNSQIIKELKLDKFLDVELAGRYAQYDHSVKLNDIIERFSL